jgi:hypothetical protein
MRVKKWPRLTFLRGKKVWNRENGGVVGDVLDGKFLRRGKGKIVVGRMEWRSMGCWLEKETSGVRLCVLFEMSSASL